MEGELQAGLPGSAKSSVSTRTKYLLWVSLFTPCIAMGHAACIKSTWHCKFT